MGASLHRSILFSACVLSLVGASCRSDPTHTPPPPPLPVTPTTPPAPTPEPTSEDAPAPTTSAGSTANEEAATAAKGSTSDQAAKQSKPSNAKSTGTSLYDLVERGEATMPTSPQTSAPATPTPTPTPAPAIPSTPTPAAPAPSTPAPSAPKGKVKIPSTANVRVEIPSGLQATLDLDTRMQPWANSVIPVIDSCYTKELKSNPSAAGVIAVRITMHSESRPDADIKSLPPALSGVVACATGGLMRIKMPLFTGKEGEKHDVNIRFTP